MAQWTSQSKQPASWVAPLPIERTNEVYEFLIGDTFKLDIGDGFNLSINTERVEMFWDTTDKTQGGNQWPETIVEPTDQFLDIGDGFSLLIDDTHKLIIDPKRSEIPWNTVSKQPATY